MTAIRVIPCLDVRDGRVVKGTKFVDLRDSGDPVERALHYGEAGADELCMLDISASEEGRRAHLHTVTAIAETLFIPLTAGGGVNGCEAVARLLQAGADKVTINSGAVERPELIEEASREFGAQCIVVAVDVRRTGSGWRVFTHAGKRDTGRDGLAWIREAAERGAGEILLTSMDADGTRAGFDLQLLRAAGECSTLPLIASGGAGEPAHMLAAVREGGADAVLAAGILHDGVWTLGQIKDCLQEGGVETRR